MLWIRSQDKKRLVPADEKIYLFEGLSKYKIICGTCTLGEYENEKKVIHIINEIQEALMFPSMEDGTNLYENNVYEMPEK